MSQESIPAEPILFTPEELTLLGDEQFFRAKARIMKKMKAIVEGVYDGLQQELAGVTLLAPEGFSPKSHPFVKREHLEDSPYQYLDYFKTVRGEGKCTSRTPPWGALRSVSSCRSSRHKQPVCHSERSEESQASGFRPFALLRVTRPDLSALSEIASGFHGRGSG